MIKYDLEFLQRELKYAFKWMTRATDLAKQGEFSSASYAMTVAQQHWNDCQHQYDKYIDDSEKIDWNSVVEEALELAKKELTEETIE